MTPISDIEKLELLPEQLRKLTYSFDSRKRMEEIIEFIPSIIADWKQMRGEIERLTKERDEAYERAAQISDKYVDGRQSNMADIIAGEIRAMKAKEPKT